MMKTKRKETRADQIVRLMRGKGWFRYNDACRALKVSGLSTALIDLRIERRVLSRIGPTYEYRVKD